MKTLEIKNLQLNELTQDQLLVIGGGESGWYWLAYAVGLTMSEPVRDGVRRGAGGYGGALR